MTEQEFQHNARGAEYLRRLSETPDVYFWEGYLRGVRRHYHGENFGTADEHAMWMNSAHETRYQQRRFRGLGYQCGFEGTAIATAMKQCQQAVSRSESAAALGSYTSPAKTAAARENAKRPRPNAQGKPKPRKPKSE